MEPAAFLCTACGYRHDAPVWYFREWENRSPTYVCADQYEELPDKSQWRQMNPAGDSLVQ
jgi:hypothetical protein